VLTSDRTFSGGEEFAYNLKHFGRATIVGETTVGGAHPTEPVELPRDFVMGVPNARPVHPVTGTNWEGSGVEPDIAVPAETALEVALRRATR
jgi:C-terminal processing protease CtpA/Prc